MSKQKQLSATTTNRPKYTLGPLFLALATPIALADDIGILTLYEGGEKTQHEQALKQVSSSLNSANCNIRRKGIIADVQGDLASEEPNRFLLVECQNSLLNSAGSTPFDTLSTDNLPVIIAEGPMTQFSAFDSQGVNERAYIIKVSQYNNSHPQQREADVTALTKQAQQRPNHYKNEAFIHVTRALGMIRPDEVVVLYYDTARDGEKFRGSNDDILDKIGQFNNDHLVRYNYFSGKLTP